MTPNNLHPNDNLVAEVEGGCGSGVVGGIGSIIPTIVVVVAVTGFSREGRWERGKGVEVVVVEVGIKENRRVEEGLAG